MMTSSLFCSYICGLRLFKITLNLLVVLLQGSRESCKLYRTQMQKAELLGKGGQGAVYLLPSGEDKAVDGKRMTLKIGAIDSKACIEQAS